MEKRVPTGLLIEVGDGVTYVEFVFEKLPPIFCSRCHKIGHKVDVCEDELSQLDDIPCLPENHELLAMQLLAHSHQQEQQALPPPSEPSRPTPDRQRVASP